MTDDIDIDELEPDTDVAAPETVPDPGDELRRDVEESIAKQRIKKGDPEPYRHLEGRADSFPGGRYEGLEEFAQEAQRNGTTIQSAVKDYAEAEKALRRDFAGGVEHICQKMGVDPRALVGELHQRYFGPNGNQHAAMAAQQHQQSQIDRSIAEFAKDPKNGHFSELRMDMARLVASGRANDLKSAYNMALRAHPMHAKAMMSRSYAKRDSDMNSMRKRKR
jgi:hypothetical protein